MKSFTRRVVSLALSCFVLLSGTASIASAQSSSAGVIYQAHVQDIGWQEFVSNGDVSGTTGKSKRLEAIAVKLENTAGGIKYRVHVQDAGWMDWKNDGGVSGTSGQSKRLEAVQMSLTGAAADLYDIYYRVHVQDIGWQDWVKNGATAGTTGQSRRAEAIEIQLVIKGGSVLGTVRDTIITITPVTMTLAAGTAGTITAAVRSVTLTDTSVAWTSSDTAVASVSGGIVTALRAGTATITASTADKNTASCTVTVTGGGSSIPVTPALPELALNEVRVINAATVVFGCVAEPSTVIWNGNPASGISYDAAAKTATITVPKITATANTLTAGAAGYSSSTVHYIIPVGTYDNLLVMSTAGELAQAIAAQQDGQSWILEAGIYDLDAALLAIYGSWTNPAPSAQTGWYFPIHADHLTITGEGTPVLTSSVVSANGAWASQDFITIWGSDVTIDGVNIRSKQETNKAIEVFASNFTLKNAVILANTVARAPEETSTGSLFSGSIYFNAMNPDIGSALLENVTLSGWIAVEKLISSGTVTLRNSVIDFRGNIYANYLWDGTRYQYGVISKNSRIVSEGFKVLVDVNQYNLQVNILDRVPANTIVEFAAGTYYVPAELAVPAGVTLDTATNGAVIEVMPADTVFVYNVPEFNAALNNTAIATIRMAAGIYEFSSQISVDRTVSIIGAGDATILKVSADLGTASVSKHALSIRSSNHVTLKNMIIDSASLAYGVNMYKSQSVLLENVTLKNSKGAGLTVNGSDVAAVNLTTAGNTWGAVNVDPGSGVSVPSSFTLTGSGALTEAAQIWSDGAHVTATATVSVTAAGYTAQPQAGTLIIWSNH